jgi:hypothetical protein
MAHHGGSSSSSGSSSGSSKIIKDFILGGTSGAIAKTIAAPIERVKLLLQTQENNPKLMERPYKGRNSYTKELLTVLKDALTRKDSHLSGEAIGLTSLDTSLLKLLISQQKTHFIDYSSKVLTQK